MEILIFLAIILLSLTPLFLAIFWVQRRALRGKRVMDAKNKVEIAGEALAAPITLYGSAASGTVSQIDNPNFNSSHSVSLEYDPGKPPIDDR